MNREDALNIIKDIYAKSVFSERNALESFIPEIKDYSEDDKVRNALVEHLSNLPDYDTYSGVKASEMLAWVEKLCNERNKLIKEEKSDNAITKFKKGDWIVNNLSLDKKIIYKVEHATDMQYVVQSQSTGLTEIFWRGQLDDYYHLWTINDARDGDILADYCDDFNNPLIFILKKFEHVDFGLSQFSDYSSHCFLTMNDNQKFREGNYHHMHDIRPATKEQCDTLFKKMDDAGYTWDAGKKELMIKNPQFNVGDWVVDYFIKDPLCILDCADPHGYKYVTLDGKSFWTDVKYANKYWHLWTIQDAKDGDVLAEDSCIFIIRKLCDNSTTAKTYCTLYNDGDFDDGTMLYFDVDSTQPATKEQRDILFQKMHEAGYEWDEEKKECRVIPKLKVGDWVVDEEDNYVYQVRRVISNVSNGSFSYDLSDNGYFYSTKTNYHLWTIQDAKDGDVLVRDDEKIICIFESIKSGNSSSFCTHCALFDEYFTLSKFDFDGERFHPATKEQRDILFKKMDETGYKWDLGKKELTGERKGPRFVPGNWITDGTNVYVIYRIIDNRVWVMSSYGGDTMYLPLSDVENNYHFWSINNAEDGDVIESDNDVFIFRKIDSGVFITCHCCLHKDGSFIDEDCELAYTENLNFRPASMHKRKLLFDKIKETGHEWDSVKKELKSSVTKFKTGDWIINEKGDVAHINDVKEDAYGTLRYYIEFTNGTKTDPMPCFADDTFRLWTIEDAKDGDTLISYDGYPFIYDGYHGDKYVGGYGGIRENGHFLINVAEIWSRDESGKNIPLHPATEAEQSYMLKIMSNEGLIWDKKNKIIKNDYTISIE